LFFLKSKFVQRHYPYSNEYADKRETLYGTAEMVG
jgi:hypothetical protein